MIPTRPATDDDITLDFEGRATAVCVSFFHDMSANRYVGNGFRRPRKVGGAWVVRRYADRRLMVRTDRAGRYPDFVVAS